MLIAKSWIFKDNKVNLIYQEQIYDEKVLIRKRIMDHETQ